MTYKLKYFNIQSLSLHDGNGIRDTIFLKGCPLRCLWCANPESQTLEKEEGFGYYEKTTEEIIKHLEKDALFYRRSGGGVTLSGGEPFMQGDAVIDLLSKCKESLWNTACETSSFVDTEILKKAIPYIDTFYCDIKAIDSEKHKMLTGVGNELILSNIKMLYDNGCNIIIRYPVIPGQNNSGEDQKLLMKWIKENIPGTLLEFLPYHRLGVSKYEKLGRDYALPDLKAPTDKYMKSLVEKFSNEGINCKFR